MPAKRVFTSADDIFRIYIKSYGVLPPQQKEIAERLSADVLTNFRKQIKQVALTTETKKPEKKR